MTYLVTFADGTAPVRFGSLETLDVDQWSQDFYGFGETEDEEIYEFEFIDVETEVLKWFEQDLDTWHSVVSYEVK